MSGTLLHYTTTVLESIQVLTLARQRRLDPKEYIHREHPIQQGIRSTLEYMMEIDLKDARLGIHGCSIPTWGVPIKASRKALRETPKGLRGFTKSNGYLSLLCG
jgi:L-asparaginase II